MLGTDYLMQIVKRKVDDYLEESDYEVCFNHDNGWDLFTKLLNAEKVKIRDIPLAITIYVPSRETARFWGTNSQIACIRQCIEEREVGIMAQNEDLALSWLDEFFRDTCKKLRVYLDESNQH